MPAHIFTLGATVALCAQVFSILLLRWDYPLDVYEPVIDWMASGVPSAWQVQGNALLGFLLLGAAAFVYSIALGSAFAFFVALVQKFLGAKKTA